MHKKVAEEVNKHFEQVIGEAAQRKVTCNYCNLSFAGSATRKRAHLLQILGDGPGRCSGHGRGLGGVQSFFQRLFQAFLVIM